MRWYFFPDGSTLCPPPALVHCLPQRTHVRQPPALQLKRPFVALFGCDSEGHIYRRVRCNQPSAFTGTVSVSPAAGVRLLSCISCLSVPGTLSLREITSPNASLKELRLFGLATDNLRPGLPIFLQIRRPTPKPVFIACQGAYAGRKQWKILQELRCLPGVV